MQIAFKQFQQSLWVCCPAIYRLQLGRTCRVLAFYNGQIVVYSFADSIMNFKGGHKAATEPGRVIEGADEGCQVLSLQL